MTPKLLHQLIIPMPPHSLQNFKNITTRPTFSFSKVLISSNFKANQRISVSIPIKTEKENGQ